LIRERFAKLLHIFRASIFIARYMGAWKNSMCLNATALRRRTPNAEVLHCDI
jgi:hypothetical protein